jgi:catechol 2,3-dioxygenase-like lactoylglutathione lyase family enzyme
MIEITHPNDESVTEEYVREMDNNPPEVKAITQDMKLGLFNHASPLTSKPEMMTNFFGQLGLKTGFTRPNPDENGTSILGLGNSKEPDFLKYLTKPSVRRGAVGRGSIHHIAMAVADDEAQRKILRFFDEKGIHNSGIIDRFYFHSLYFRDVEGNLLEIATKEPGYAVDESADTLGTKLALPAWLEPERSEIEAHLAKVDEGNVSSWPPNYPQISTSPERI